MKKTQESFEYAKRARENAYAPYSHFKVGAALQLSNGEIITGCNVENVSLGATVCAERVALFSAIARYGAIKADSLVVVTDHDPPAVPCALCLQVLMEHVPPEFPIHIADINGVVETLTLGQLLPHRFTDFQ